MKKLYRKKKIALFKLTGFGYRGGLEKFFLEFALFVKKHELAHVDIITMDENFSRKFSNLLNFYYLRKKNKVSNYFNNEEIEKKLNGILYRRATSFINLREILKEYDVIYTKNEIVEAFFLKFFIGYKNIPPITFGCHTQLHFKSCISMHEKIHNFLYGKFFYKFLTKGVRQFHVLNTYDKEILCKYGFSDNVFLIPNSFQHDIFLKNLQTYKFGMQSVDDFYHIAWIGRLSKDKGVLYLKEIIEKCNKDIENKIMWHIIGEGPDKCIFDKMSNEGINITIHGYVNNEYIPSLLSQCNLLVLTSKNETFGYTILEALSVNVPVIAFPAPGPKDVIADNYWGFLPETIDEFVKSIKNLVINGFVIRSDASLIFERFKSSNIYPKLAKRIVGK
ncbi:MAG: glycosyltransferase [Candidatus Moranbacteria bacterium]|jgi:glycosyltransferase involved in cell wall biosynthesis|nr:glycosyltransferase [Candidatus Moranbacteria bacterium]